MCLSWLNKSWPSHLSCFSVILLLNILFALLFLVDQVVVQFFFSSFCLLTAKKVKNLTGMLSHSNKIFTFAHTRGNENLSKQAGIPLLIFTAKQYSTN
jgi:hypothetical protein